MTLGDPLPGESFVAMIDADRRRHPYPEGEWRFGDKLAQSYRDAHRKIRRAEMFEELIEMITAQPPTTAEESQ